MIVRHIWLTLPNMNFDSLFYQILCNYKVNLDGTVNVVIPSSVVKHIEDGQPLFSILLKAYNVSMVSDMVDINSAQLQQEVYFSDFSIGKVELSFIEKTVPLSFAST